MKLKYIAKEFGRKVAPKEKNSFNENLIEINALAYEAGAQFLLTHLLDSLNEEVQKLDDYPMMTERKYAIIRMKEKILNEWDKLREEN